MFYFCCCFVLVYCFLVLFVCFIHFSLRPCLPCVSYSSCFYLFVYLWICAFIINLSSLRLSFVLSSFICFSLFIYLFIFLHPCLRFVYIYLFFVVYFPYVFVFVLSLFNFIVYLFIHFPCIVFFSLLLSVCMKGSWQNSIKVDIIWSLTVLFMAQIRSEWKKLQPLMNTAVIASHYVICLSCLCTGIELRSCTLRGDDASQFATSSLLGGWKYSSVWQLFPFVSCLSCVVS